MVKRKKFKNILKQMLLKRGFRIQNISYFNFLDSLMQQLITKQKPLTILQIGANDGRRFDPIFEFITVHHKNVDAYLVEPIKDYYEELVLNYKGYPQVKTYNIALHNTAKKVTLFRLKKSYENKVPEMAKGIASIHENHHQRTGIPKDYMEEEVVDAVSLHEFVANNAIPHIDVLVCDIEGYDYELLKAIDFNIFRPKIIHFEHGLKHQTMTTKEFEDITARLTRHNYQLFINEADVTAYQTNFLFNS